MSDMEVVFVLKKGKKLKKAMKERGVTINKMADVLGISRYTLSGKIRGLHGFTLSELRFLRNYLQLTDEEIITIFFEN